MDRKVLSVDVSCHGQSQRSQASKLAISLTSFLTILSIHSPHSPLLPLISPLQLATSRTRVLLGSCRHWGFAPRGVGERMEMVDSPLPQGLKSPKAMQTSASPLVWILPEIKKKKFMLLNIDSFQFLPIRAGL